MTEIVLPEGGYNFWELPAPDGAVWEWPTKGWVGGVFAIDEDDRTYTIPAEVRVLVCVD